MALLAWPFYLLIPAFVLIHLAESPYTKVEESFNIQAIHDILVHGIPKENFDQFFTANYDHISFPGSVPRTFVGALALSGLSKPLLALSSSRFQSQLIVRGVLGLANAISLIVVGRSVEKAFGTAAGIWYALFQASQFHVIYYASRTLPNMFAFVFSNFALASLLKAYLVPFDANSVTNYHRRSLYLLTIAGVIFRSELAILVATFTVYLFVTRKISITGAIIPAGLGGLVAGLICTVPIDSFFWQSFPLWPEWTAFYYNTIQGHSADWGVSPWHFYFANSLPRLLLNPAAYLIGIPIAVLNAATRRRSLDILIPLLGFVGIYSFLPHKEWRFVIYVIPGLTAVAGVGAGWIWNRRGKDAIYATLTLALVGSVVLSFVASTGLLVISGLNYPGGEALNILHKGMEHPPGHHQVYFDNLACQTGVTRFLESHEGPQTVLDVLEAKEAQNPNSWTYDKTEDPIVLRDPMFWTKFTYVLAESPETVIGSWETVHTVYGFSGLRILKPGQPSSPAIDPMDDGELLVWDWTYEVASFWRELEKKLRNVLRGYWVEVKMDPKIRILRNGMPSTSGYV